MPEPPREREVKEPPPDPRREPVLYLVATSHLDTQWRWTVRDTIREFLPRTLRDNFAAFDRHPALVLSFEGAFRYMLAEEYHPELFDELKSWVKRGRWRPAGSMLDAPDVNIPSPESLIRHVLYGNRYFERVFGRRTRDLFLPDCFGFGWALPAVAAHCGLLGFSSQKFGKWMAPAEIPFDLGIWEGPDGSRILAALRPEGYGEGLAEDLSRARRWQERVRRTGAGGGVQAALMYAGVGDRGGALDEASLGWLEKSVDGDGPLAVRVAASEDLFLDLWDGGGGTGSPAAHRLPYHLESLPVHRDELLLPTHGTGCLTSKAILKRRNRRCELLADAAERAAAAADWLGALPYPGERLTDAWTRFLWHQMHDDLTGTSIPSAYRITVNDLALALNQFADVLAESVGAVGRELDTRCGSPCALVAFNPLAFEREDLVEATLPWPGGAPATLAVVDPEGRERPAQVLERWADGVRLLFSARLPPLGFAVFEVRPAAAETTDRPASLEAAPGRLENGRYLARLDADGDLAGLYDKALGAELLAAPAGLELLADRSARWPAWEIRAEDLEAPPRGRFAGPARVQVIERGPLRAAVAVERRAAGSSARQIYRLAAGAAGERLEIEHHLDWRTRGRLLKASFPLAFANREATYDLGLGVATRGNNVRRRYEVPAQQWADLSAPDGRAGVTISNDCRYGWDKPDDRTLRLTLVRSPRVGRRFRHQGGQDLGPHRVLLALHGHAGDWAAGGAPRQAARLNQPILAFRVPPGDGPLGRSFSFLGARPEGVAVRAVKRSEDGGELVVRLQETLGRRVPRVELDAAAPVGAVRELDGAEEPLRPDAVRDTRLDASLGPYQPRTFGVALAPAERPAAPPRSTPVELPLDRPAASFHRPRRRVDFDGRGRSLPGELLPREVRCGGVLLRLGPAEPDRPHCLACRGQSLSLPAGGLGFGSVWLLAAAVGGDREAVFTLGGRDVTRTVHDWSAPIAEWVRRREIWGLPLLPSLPPYIRRRPVAWIAGHRHDRRVRDEPYALCYLFCYRLELPAGADELRLPDEPRIRLFAASLAADDPRAEPAAPLFD